MMLNCNKTKNPSGIINTDQITLITKTFPYIKKDIIIHVFDISQCKDTE